MWSGYSVFKLQRNYIPVIYYKRNNIKQPYNFYTYSDNPNISHTNVRQIAHRGDAVRAALPERGQHCVRKDIVRGELPALVAQAQAERVLHSHHAGEHAQPGAELAHVQRVAFLRIQWLVGADAVCADPGRRGEARQAVRKEQDRQLASKARAC